MRSSTLNIGSTVTCPVHMDKGYETMIGMVVGLYDRFYRVMFKINEKYTVYESYSYYGPLN